MSKVLSGGIFSFLVIIWTIISIVFIVIIYKRLPKHILLILGTLLGSIIFALGVTGLFSGLSNTLRALAGTTTIEIKDLVVEGNRTAKIPFSLGSIITIIYFGILSILVVIKKGIIKKWSLWVGWIVFLLLTFVLSYFKHSSNVKLVMGFGKVMSYDKKIPAEILPFIKTGAFAILTSLLLSVAYLLITILITIYKRKEKNSETNSL